MPASGRARHGNNPLPGLAAAAAATAAGNLKESLPVECRDRLARDHFGRPSTTRWALSSDK